MSLGLSARAEAEWRGQAGCSNWVIVSMKRDGRRRLVGVIDATACCVSLGGL
jgi:hypothetical protein